MENSSGALYKSLENICGDLMDFLGYEKWTKEDRQIQFVINRRFDSPPVSRGAYRMNRTGRRLENRIPISFLKPQVAPFNLFLPANHTGVMIPLK